MDTDSSRDITADTLDRLRELGFNVTVTMSAQLRADGKREHTKRIIYEKETSHDLVVEHIMAVHQEIPELLTEAEVRKVIEKRNANPNSFVDDHAVAKPQRSVLKLGMDVDPSQDLSFVFQTRRKRGIITAIVSFFVMIVGLIVDAVNKG